MSRDELLAELATLPHAGRMHHMVELGRATDPASVAALAEMRRGNGYERRLALQATWGSRDLAVAAEDLADPAALEMSHGLRPDELEAIEAALTPAGDERLRRLALAALCAQVGPLRLGWTVERLARLEAFRTDLSPLVAEAAQFTFPPD